MRWQQGISLMAMMVALSACASTMDRLEQVGKPPPFAHVDNPAKKPEYPISWPMPAATPPTTKYANSLWQPGARAFFRDQRAARVGDILRVKIKLKDKAELNNETTRTRENADTLGMPQVLGMQNELVNWIPGKQNVANLLSTESNTDLKGVGDIKREETIETQVAATVVQLLPNGNMVIDGKQEIRVNFEIREVSVRGIIRPQDINSDNTIDSTQVAEARITYGGRGQITDVQQPRWGSQVIDAIAPF